MKELLVLQGFLSPPRQAEGLSQYIANKTNYNPHTLDGSMRNLWRGQKQRVVDAVHAITDRTQKKIGIVGHSLGGLHGAEVAFENPDEVDEVIAVFSPIHYLSGKPSEVRATTIFSSIDRIIRDPLGRNEKWDRNIRYDSADHSAIWKEQPMREIIIANLKQTAKNQ